MGDLGSKLPPLLTGTVWKAGSDVEVSWALKAWHGGGYSYRLCQADEELNEACFQKMHLNYTGLSSLRWGGLGGNRTYFNSTARGWEVPNQRHKKKGHVRTYRKRGMAPYKKRACAV